MKPALTGTVTFALPRRYLEERPPGLLPAPQPVGRVVGLPGWLGQPILRATREHQRSGAPQIYPVPHRDVDRRDLRPRPHDPTHDLPAMHEVGHAPPLHPGVLEPPYEHALGAPHRRNVEKEPDVRGQPHPPRVGEPLGVQYHRVHRRLHLPQGPHDGRYLPERQEPRHVRELEGRLEPPHLHHGEPGEVEHGDRRVSPLPLRRDVGPGHVAHAPQIQRRTRHHPRRELPLQTPRLSRRQRKPVKLLDPHEQRRLSQKTPQRPRRNVNPPRKDQPDRWNLEGGTVPSAGARFNLNITFTVLHCLCYVVTVSLRGGNTLVTKRRFARELPSEQRKSLKLKLRVRALETPLFGLSPAS